MPEAQSLCIVLLCTIYNTLFSKTSFPEIKPFLPSPCVPLRRSFGSGYQIPQGQVDCSNTINVLNLGIISFPPILFQSFSSRRLLIVTLLMHLLLEASLIHFAVRWGTNNKTSPGQLGWQLPRDREGYGSLDSETQNALVCQWQGMERPNELLSHSKHSSTPMTLLARSHG